MKSAKFTHWIVILALMVIALLPASWPVEAATGSTWQKATQGMWGGRPNSIAVSPAFADDHLVLTGTSHGIFRSADAGVTWTRSAGIDGGLEYDAIRFSPTFASDQTAFTWDGDKLYRSTDAGQTWSLYYTAAASIYALALSPAFASDHTALLGAYGQGLYKTTDSGATWQPANTGLTDTYILSAAFSPSFATDQTVMVGTHGDGFFISTNGGASWTARNSGLRTYSGGDYYNISAITPSPGFASDQIIFARVLGYLYRTTNAGASWTQVGGLPLNLVSLALPPDFAASHKGYASVHYYLGDGKYIYQTTDSGATWTQTASNELAWQIGLGVDDGDDVYLFANSDSGVARSLDEGLTWSIVNTGIDEITVSSLAVSPGFTTDQTIFAIANNFLFSSADGAQSWTQLYPHNFLSAPGRPTGAAQNLLSSTAERLHAVAVSPAYASDQTVFAAAEIGLFRSQDGGATWQLGSSGLPADTRVLSIGVSPNFANDQRVFAGLDATNDNVYLSEDGGETWRATGDTNAEAVHGFVFSPHYSQDGIIYSLHQGISYDMRKSSGDYSLWVNNAPGGSIYGLALSPGYPADQTIYALWNNGWATMLYQTTDDGESWGPISYFNDDDIATGLLISPDFTSDQTFYASFYDRGVMRSTDGGATWSAINAGLGEQSVMALALLGEPGRLIAGTANQSAWLYTASDNALPIIFIPLIKK